MIGFAPHGAAAADLGGYDEGDKERGAVIEGPPVVRRDYDEGPMSLITVPHIIVLIPITLDIILSLGAALLVRPALWVRIWNGHRGLGPPRMAVK